MMEPTSTSALLSHAETGDSRGLPAAARYTRRLRASAKTLLVNLAIRGWLPAAAADYLIQRGGLQHD
jgi:hypothetical protein